MTIKRYVQDLLKAKRFAGQIVHHRRLPGKQARYAASAAELKPELLTLLQAKGIKALYTHQQLALAHIRQGQNVLISTDTASGKSLIYHLACLEAFLQNSQCSALYLFPLKALAQDQLNQLKSFSQHLPQRPRLAIFDGDTPAKARQIIKNSPPNILISNPDMLHQGILPYHQRWQDFFSNLRFIVIDEVHTYRGVMGSNMAWVFRRLNRICRHYQAQPQFILSSATIGNPQELAEQLTGQPVQVIEQNGAPRAKRHFLIINPLQNSPGRAAMLLLQSAMIRGLRSIVYTKSRKMTELLTTWSKQQLPRLAAKISAYRAGFLPGQRRAIEKKLAQGELLAVISTSALELGIDIGTLDLCILLGYPGSIMATWQRSGRVGRRHQESAIILLANEDNLDQYFVAHPDKLFSLPPEQAVINLNNPQISRQQLLCAAQELPLHPEEDWLNSTGLKSVLHELLTAGSLVQTAAPHSLLCNPAPPCHHKVNLRGCGQPLAIINKRNGKEIGMIDHFRSLHETHPGAVYLHQSKTYLICDLQLATKTVLAQEQKLNYFTRPLSAKQTEILDCWAEKQIGPYKLAAGWLRVTERITGFEKRSVLGQRLLGSFSLDLEPLIFETQGIWLTIPQTVQQELEKRQLHFMGSIHALEHCLIGVLPLLVLADRNDFGGISQPCHPQLQQAGIFVYDSLPGGAGLCRQGFVNYRELFALAWQTISACHCALGCPGCIHSPKCGAGNRPLDKQGCTLLLSVAQPHVEQQTKHRVKVQAYVDQDKRYLHPAQDHKRPLLPEIPGNDTISTQKMIPVHSSGHFVVLDLETRRSAQEVGGWHQSHKMGISCAVLYDSRRDEFRSYLSQEIAELISDLKKARLVIGFNLLGFDYKVLGVRSSFDLYSLPTLDILQEIRKRLGYRLSLDHVARHTLGAAKSAHGLQAITWWKEGKIDKIIDYCTQDVRLTRDLYIFGHTQGYLLFCNKAQKIVRLQVQW